MANTVEEVRVVGDSSSGAIVLGVIGAGVAVLAVNYAVSDVGESWLAQITSSLKTSSKDKASADDELKLKADKERARLEMSKRLQRGSQATPTRQQSQTQSQRQQTSAPRQSSQAAPAQSLAQPRRQPIPRKPQPEATATATNFVSKTFGGPPSSPVTKPGGADTGVQSAQRMLNTFFQAHVIDEDGKIGPHTIDAISQFQAAQKLPVTGLIDDKTHDFLVQISTPLSDGRGQTRGQTKTGQDSSSHYSHLIEPTDRSQPDWWGGLKEMASFWLLPPPITYGRLMEKQHAAEDAHARVHTGYWTGAQGKGEGWKTETAPLGKAAQDIIARAISEGDSQTLHALSHQLAAAGFSRAAAAAGGGGGSGHGVTPLLPPPPTGHASSDIGPGF